MGASRNVKLCLPFPNAGALMPNVQPQHTAYTSARRNGAALLPAGCHRCPQPPCECPSTSQFGAGPRALLCPTCCMKQCAAGTGFHGYLAASIECILLNLISKMNLLMDLLISLPYLMLIISSVLFFFFFLNEKKKAATAVWQLCCLFVFFFSLGK